MPREGERWAVWQIVFWAVLFGAAVVAMLPGMMVWGYVETHGGGSRP